MSNKLKITIKIKKFLPKETKLKKMKRLRLKSKNPIKKLKKREKKMKKEVREKTGREKTGKEKTGKTRVMTRVTKEEMTMAKWTWSSEWEKLGKSPVDL